MTPKVTFFKVTRHLWCKKQQHSRSVFSMIIFQQPYAISIDIKTMDHIWESPSDKTITYIKHDKREVRPDTLFISDEVRPEIIHSMWLDLDGFTVVLEGYRRCSVSHDPSECHHLYDMGRHIQQPKKIFSLLLQSVGMALKISTLNVP